MGLLNGFEGQVNKASNFIKNPFDKSIAAGFDAPDFPDGFKITEILPSGADGDKVVLSGNWLPKIPFTFGGSQRIKKEYYSGYSEPSIHVLGPEEDDVVINGTFKDKRFSNPDLKNISSEMQKQMDAIRIRGNYIRIQLGEFERYAILLRSKFELKRLSNIDYSITFSIIGFNAPKNAKFIQRQKEIPFGINKELIALAQDFNNAASNIPATVPLSIADGINLIVGEVAETIAAVTSFVDQVFSTIQDVKQAVNRVKGLIKYAQQKVKSFKNQLAQITSFNTSLTIASRYGSAKYVASNTANASQLVSLLERLRSQFDNVSNDLPLARVLIKSGDTLQKIAVKYYGNSNDWKKIYDYNDLSSTELIVGNLLEIPRL